MRHRYIFTPLKDGKYKNFMDKVRPWLAVHDYYELYKTTREAWFTRGMVVGVAAALFIGFSLFLVRDFGTALAQNAFSWKTPLYMLGHWGEPAFHYFIIGASVGALFGMVEPPGIPYDKENPGATNNGFPPQES